MCMGWFGWLGVVQLCLLQAKLTLMMWQQVGAAFVLPNSRVAAGVDWVWQMQAATHAGKWCAQHLEMHGCLG